MAYTWFLLFSCSIFIAAIIGWVRFRRIAPAFRPFIYCIWIGSVNEILSMTLPLAGYKIDLNNNIYVLLESGLVLWQVRQWEGFGSWHRLFPVVLASFGMVWITENFLISSITYTGSYFRLYYSFIIVILAIQVNNSLIISEKGLLLRNATFLVCTGFIIYFTYKVLIEIFWLYGLNSSPGFLVNVYSILIWINLFANIIYSFAILWMPAKQRFIMPY